MPKATPRSPVLASPPNMDVNGIRFKTQVYTQPVCVAAFLIENILVVMVHGDVGREYNPFQSREVGLYAYPSQNIVEVVV